MKRKIMFGCVLITFLLMILPSISAIEFNEIVNENESILKDISVNERVEDLKIRILNNLNDDILSILWDIINDIIGAIVIFLTFSGIDTLFILLIPPFISIPLIAMMTLIEFGVYGAILFDMIRNIFNLITNIVSPTSSFSFNY